MIVAVTGASGFIGRRLVGRLLERGDSVRVLTRRTTPLDFDKAVCVHRADLAHDDESGALVRFLTGAEALYHCAGEVKSEADMQAVHVDGTARLVLASAGAIRHWVQLSSVGAYGPVRDGVVTEDAPLNPVGTYERTKVSSDHLVEQAARRGAFTYTILRPSNVFGAGMPNQSLFHLITAVERRMFFFIGRPGASAEYIHVDNVVDALILSGTEPKASGRVYNISDHRTLEHFISVLAAAVGVRPPAVRLPEYPVRMLARLLGRVPGSPLTESRVDALVTRAVYSISRIEDELGYRYRVCMEDALRELALARVRK